MEREQSFYSIDNSKTEFTFVEEAVGARNILEKFDIRESSAVELQESDLLNKSFSSVDRQADINDISAINQPQPQLQCSLCLQQQIDCLSIPPQASPEQLKAIQQRLATLRNTQSLLQKQMAAIHQMLSKQGSKELLGGFMRKCTYHAEDAQSSSKEQVEVRLTQEAHVGEERRQERKHFDIKPKRVETGSEKAANAKYKECSFNRKAVLLEDTDNQYRVEVTYQRVKVLINVVNTQRGETNFIHAARINEPNFVDKVSQTLLYPIEEYTPKRFTLSLSIMLLIFEQGKQKQQANLLQVQEIRTISVPLPINYFIHPRLGTVSPEGLERIRRKMYVYEIDINYNADYAAYTRLMQEGWVGNKWVSVGGSKRLIWVQLGEMREKEGNFGVGFRVGCKQKDSQEAVDLIEYLCFMLAI